MVKKLLVSMMFFQSLFLIGQSEQLEFSQSENDKVLIPANAAYELGNNSFTVEAVINASETQNVGFPMIVSKRGSEPFSGFFLALDQVGSDYHLFVQVDGLNYFADQSRGIPLNDGQCHHVAARRDGDMISIFVDGVMVADATIGSNREINNDANIFIGLDEPTGNGFNGIIGEVRFWDVARSDEEIQNNSLVALSETQPSGLIGYWQLDETGNEQSITDLSGTSNNGFLGNSNTVDNQDPERISGNCIEKNVQNQLVFDVSENDKVLIPANAAYELGNNSFTVEAVINASETQNVSFPMIVSKRGSEPFSGFFLALDQVGADYYLFVQVDGLNYFADQSRGIPLNDGQCHHVAARRDGDMISIFVDGAMVANATIGSNREINNDADIFIGLDEPTGNGFNGIIGEVRFWDIARSDQEILDNSSMELSETQPSGLIGYWQLDEIGSQQAVGDLSVTSNNGVLGDTNASENNDPEVIEGFCIAQTLSVTDIDRNTQKIAVYPNPFTDSITFVNEINNGSYELYSITGKLVMSGAITESKSLVFTDISSGTYFLTVKDKVGNQQVIKLVKI
ncbi:LamG-like jellyroll fold domain-containing protein [Aquimarina litoralis]|uniref:LamG-like jellyroll fold domain-containing protein n=1 Tax=Aquimarina litoralis TaxID=584605 RepID=UPI001C58BD13|nr:LamG-like jellyroll fold domain-containing protein [Aquimarina litoralis]MBW1298520.1 T9SS type A sorting domain-containing protein [Aquimarina litoralis]